MMTREEHIARAMLLGYRYLDWANMYLDQHRYIDADTLEPIEPFEAMSRIRKDFEDMANEPDSNLLTTPIQLCI